MTKMTEGANDRPNDETVAQRGGGIPDDPAAPAAASDDEIARVRDGDGAEDRQDETADLERQLEWPKHGTA